MDDTTPTPHAGSDPADLDVDHLKAERDALQAQVDTLTKRKGFGNRAKQITATLLVLVFALSFLASGVGIWLHRNTLNRDVWNERVVPLGKSPELQAALSTWTTEQLMATVKPEKLISDALPERAKILATPLSSAIEGFVSDKVDQFFASRRFEELWVLAATKAHDQAVDALRGNYDNIQADDEKIVINLLPLIDAVLNDVLAEAPGLVGSSVKLPKVSVDDVPDKARERLGTALGVDLGENFGTITVYDGGKLSLAQKAVRWFDQAVVGTTILAVLSFAGALWLSRRRRRTLFQLLGAAAIACIAVRRIVFLLQDEVSTIVKVDVNREAAGVVTATFANPLTNGAATALWVIAIIAVVAWITGPYRAAVSLRTMAIGTAGTVTTAVGDRARDPETTEWIVGHADLLRIVGYGLGALLLWFVDLTWVSFLLIALFVIAWQVLLNRVAPAEHEPDVSE